MADRYLLESGSPDGYLLEDGSGVLLLEAAPTTTGGTLNLLGVGCWFVIVFLSSLLEDMH